MPAYWPGLSSRIPAAIPMRRWSCSNTLRQEQILTPTSAGWAWDEAALSSLLTRSKVAELATARLAVLPSACRGALEAMACLGGRAELSVLAVATGSAEAMEQRLAPALEEGVLVAEHGRSRCGEIPPRSHP